MCKCITFKLYSVFQMNYYKNSIIADASTRCVIFFSRAFLVTSMIVLHPCLPKRNCFQYLLTTLDFFFFLRFFLHSSGVCLDALTDSPHFEHLIYVCNPLSNTKL